MAQSIPHAPIYNWALDGEQKPIPISEAKRGEKYFCPVCHGYMIAKMGDVKQHHFAHVNLFQCSPENAMRAVAGRWLAAALRTRLQAQQSAFIPWKNQEGQAFTSDLLKGILTLTEGQKIGEDKGDILLLDKDQQVRLVILTGLEGPPNPEMVKRLVAQKIAVVQIQTADFNSGQVTLDGLLQHAVLAGGGWLVQAGEAGGIIVDPRLIENLLKQAVSRPPFRLCQAIPTEGEGAYVVSLEDKRFLLNQEVWQSVIGGTRHPLSREIALWTQEWTQPDHAKLVLFYVVVRKTAAFGVRRVLPNEPFQYDLNDAAFRRVATTALDLACQLVGGMVLYPR